MERQFRGPRPSCRCCTSATTCCCAWNALSEQARGAVHARTPSGRHRALVRAVRHPVLQRAKDAVHALRHHGASNKEELAWLMRRAFMVRRTKDQVLAALEKTQRPNVPVTRSTSTPSTSCRKSSRTRQKTQPGTRPSAPYPSCSGSRATPSSAPPCGTRNTGPERHRGLRAGVRASPEDARRHAGRHGGRPWCASTERPP